MKRTLVSVGFIAVMLLVINYMHAIYTEPAQEKATAEEVVFNHAEKLLKEKCFTCHNPESESHDEIVAPPLAGVQHRYKKEYPEKEEFIKHMASFLNDPQPQKAVFKGPVKRFGVMPNPSLTEDEIKIITNYLYEHPTKMPAWHESKAHKGENK